MTIHEVFSFLFLKVTYAVLTGGIIGFERSRHHKVAGLKTNILICLGSMIYTVCGLLLNVDGKGDPSKVISSIVSGIGFLGAGTIMNPSPDKVAGLTTAAMVWTVAALGILIGLDYGPMAVALALIIVSITTTVSWVEKKFGDRDE